MKFVFYDGGSFLSKFSVILLNTCQFSKNRVLLAGFCWCLRGVAGKTLEFWNQALFPCYSEVDQSFILLGWEAFLGSH